MSVTMGGCTQQPQNFSKITNGLSGCRENTNGEYNDRHFQSYHYEPLPIDESRDESRDEVPVVNRSTMCSTRTVPAIGQRNGLTKTTSLPISDNGVPFDLPDPFPELSHDRLGPVSARMYDTETNCTSSSRSTSLPTSPEKVAEIPAAGASRPDAGSPVVSQGILDGAIQSDSATIPKKMTVDIYMNERKHNSVEIDGATIVANVCDCLAQLNCSRRDSFWTVVEHIDKFNIERSLEDHELLYSTVNSWHAANNHLYFRKDFSRYELYSNPTQCFPERMVDAELPKEDPSGLMTRDERYRNLLLQSLLANQTMPDIQGFLHIREGKRAWKKFFCVLRQSGLYYISKGNVKDPRFMVLLSNLRDENIYIALNAKKVFSAPTQYGFCLAPSSDPSDKHRLKQFCVEDEQSRLCWITGMRFIKFGSQLQENFRASVRLNCDSNSLEKQDGKRRSSFGGRSSATLSFSTEKTRAASNPSESSVPFRRQSQKYKPSCDMISEPLCTCLKSSKSFTLTPGNLQLETPFSKNSQTPDWFHDAIGRDEAVSFIYNHGLTDGTFLVRHSQSLPGVFVLSFAHNSTVKHCTIHKIKVEDCWYYSLDGGLTKFIDLTQLIDFYRLNAGRLPTRLTHPVTRLL